MARERSIVVKLKAEISDFKNQMDNASRSLSDFEREQQKLGGAADTTMGRLVQSAKLQQAEWQTLGRALTVVGGAVTAVGAAAIKTGIDYNSLRQMATKSLESVTGSAQAAAEQMDRLDSFGESNWISRDVLVKAQQNMAGFGIETSKVIPYMDALSEAVAATSGSEQNFEDLAQVMGKIQSQGKITARELNEFGLRGIDAAQMIGDAMGMTANQIRDEITAGTLDADTALDALAEGMATKFEGSSDRMRDTWDGAFKNLAAAWRDLSAEMAAPLVNPEGGGFLVDLTNKAADLLNAIRDLPTPIKNVVGLMTALGGVATLAAGGFFLLAPRAVEVYGAFQTLTGQFPGLTGGFKNVVKYAGAAVAAFTAVSAVVELAGLNKGTENLDEFQRTLQRGVEDIELMGIKSMSLDEAFERLQTRDLNDWVGDKITGPLFDVHGDVERLTREFEMMGEQLADLYASDPGLAAERFDDILKETGATTQELLDLMPAYAHALEDAESAADGTSGSTEELVGALEEVGIAADGTVDSLSDYLDLLFATGLAAMSERDAHAKYQESLRGVGDAVDELIEDHGGLSAALNDSETDFDLTTDAGKLAQDAFHAVAQDALGAADAMAENGASQEDVQAHLKQTRDDLIAAANDFGITGTAADDLSDLVLGIPEGVDIETWIDDYAQQKIEELADELDILPEDINIETDADTAPAIESFGDVVDLIESAFPETSVDADVSPARGSFNSETGLWESTTTDTNLDANIIPAEATSRGLIDAWQGTTTDTNLDANTGPAAGSFNTITGQWMGQTTDTNLDANTGPAAGSFNSMTGTWSSTTTNTNVGANTQPARNAVSNLQAWFAGLKFTKTVSVIEKPGKFDGGWISPGLHEGGTVQPGLKAGGWVPGERAGYDNVLWPLHSGGQVLAQPLEGREFVVNSRDAARYPAELNAMNNGTYPTGTLEQAYSPTSAGSVTVAAPDLSGIRAEIGEMRSAIQNMRVVTNIAGRPFYGAIQEATNRFGGR